MSNCSCHKLPVFKPENLKVRNRDHFQRNNSPALHRDHEGRLKG